MGHSYHVYSAKSVEDINVLVEGPLRGRPELLDSGISVSGGLPIEQNDLFLASRYGVIAPASVFFVYTPRGLDDDAEASLFRLLADAGNLWGDQFLVLHNVEEDVTPRRSA